MHHVIIHLHGLAYPVQSQSQVFNFNSLYLFHLRTAVHSAGDREGLCTLRYKITAFPYLYDEIGNSASQNVQVTEFCAIMYSDDITGFLYIEVTLFCLTLLLVWLCRY